MIEIIEKTIHETYWLDRQNRDWLLDDDVKLRTPHRHSFGFSLDNQKVPPFSFFSESPPIGIAKMCDAVIAFLHLEKLYLFIVEQKTENPGEYQKQLANGKFFCDWLFSLYKRHGYCDDEPIYIGLFIWQPRPSPRKGGTAHRSSASVVARSHKLFSCFFEITNMHNIYLGDLVRQLP